MVKKVTTREFIEKAKSIHGNKYDYSLTNYINSKKKVTIICPKHGHGEFLQAPQKHVQRVQGCMKCHNEVRSKKQRLTVEEFLRRAKEIHGDKYDYSGVKYVNVDVKVKIICSIHGMYETTPYHHISRKQGCSACSKRRQLTTKEFIKRAKEVHGDVYDYSKSVYKTNHDKIKIICRKHGEFLQVYPSHVSSKHGCPKCGFEKISGSNNHQYKDGRSKERDQERSSRENRQWIRAVKADIPNCDCCNLSFESGVSKHAHHLNSWVDHIEERFDLNNGVCLCEDCHCEFHETYGYGGNTKLQYLQFKELGGLQYG